MFTPTRAWPIAVAALIGISGCTATPDAASNSAAGNATTVATSATSSTPATTTAAATSGTALSAAEIEGLLWMREEEQLAHDVYVALADRWDLTVFSKIAESETRHIESVIGLLDTFGVDDHAAGNPPGTFTDPTLQALYDELIAAGSASVVDALGVGARIEELDIRDLRDRLATTSEPAIERVYTRLERASGNHLRAFTTELDRLGSAYSPVVLDADDIALTSAATPGRADRPGR